MAISAGNFTVDSSFASSQTSTGITTVSGSTIALIVGLSGTQTISSVTDNYSNTYTQLDVDDTGFGARTAAYYCENITGGAGHQVTVSLSGSQNISLAVVEIRGTATASFDASAGKLFSNSGTPWLTNTTGTTAQAAEMAVVLYRFQLSGPGETYTWNNGYSLFVSANNDAFPGVAVGYKILAATGTQSGSVSTTASPICAVGYIATFKEAAVISDVLLGQACL